MSTSVFGWKDETFSGGDKLGLCDKVGNRDEVRDYVERWGYKESLLYDYSSFTYTHYKI